MTNNGGGAECVNAVRLAMAGALVPALTGVAIGIGAANLLTRYIAFMVYGITPTDPATLAGVVIILLSVATLACYIPARRAAQLDPMAALRCE